MAAMSWFVLIYGVGVGFAGRVTALLLPIVASDMERPVGGGWNSTASDSAQIVENILP
jgi:hypothetical protein